MRPIGSNDIMINSSKLPDENGASISDRPGTANPTKIVPASNQQAIDLSKFDSI
jgi:hypothetical protein